MRKCRECKREMLPAVNQRSKRKPGALHHQARGLCTQCYDRARGRVRLDRIKADVTEPVGLGEGEWVLCPRRRVMVWNGEKVAKVDLIPAPDFKACWDCGDRISSKRQFCNECRDRRRRESCALSELNSRGAA